MFAAGVPFFGSCWGLQVAVTAAGGEVRANPRGREFGFARRILLSDAGREHPLFAGKPAVFEAPTVHRDEIAALPCRRRDSGQPTTLGCRRRRSPTARGTFWGVQYHPEYDYLDIAATAERYGETLVTEGMFRDSAGARRIRRRTSRPAGEPLGCDTSLEARAGSRDAHRGAASSRDPQLAAGAGAAARDA